MDLSSSKEFSKALSDLVPVLNEALLIGGAAVIFYGYERNTTDLNILYARNDGTMLTRLATDFELLFQKENGWRRFRHRATGIHLGLIPEGGLTTYGFIPGPAVVGGEKGVISLSGLCWLKLLSGRMKDLSDIVELAKVRMDEMRTLTSQLPEDLQTRFTEALDTAQREMDTDPNLHPDSPPPDPQIIKEMAARYGKPKKDSTTA